MKVLQINSVYGTGSTGKIVKDLHNTLIEQGHESIVFYGRGSKVSEKGIYKISNQISNGIDLLITRLFNMHGFANVFNTIKVIKLIKKEKPDIIHLHNIHGYFINYILLFNYLKKIQIPVVWLLHDQWSFSGSAAYFDEGINWEKISNYDVKRLSTDYPKYLYIGFNNTPWIYSFKKRIFDINNLVIITPSNWLKKVYENFNFSKLTPKVIYNGIDTKLFKNTGHSDKKKLKILGVANIWDSRKGLKYFNQLANDLDDRFEITIVGKLEENIKLNPRIIHIDKTDNIKTLVSLYSEADIFVNVSLSDNFPTTILEAQACGTPVLTFDTGGSSESLTEKTGKYVKAGDYDELLDHISNIKSKTTEDIKICTENAERFSKKIMFEKYLLLYKDMIGERDELQ